MRLLFAIFLSLLPVASQAAGYRDMQDSMVLASDGGVKIISVMCWAYAFAYLLIAAVKIIRAVLARRRKSATTITPNGAWFFVLSGCILLTMPYIEYYSKGAVTDLGVIDKVLPSAIFNEWTMIPLLIAMPLLPWAMLIMHPPLRHLRIQGIYGLCVALVPHSMLVLVYLLA